ncbi:MAG: sugar phosphate isomerase/epimerase family protein [Anaerolineae bacterium]
MKLGFLTACFRTTPLDDIVRWAGSAGFATVELAAWPMGPGGRATNHLDVAGMNVDKAAALKALCASAGVEISCLTYCGNPLTANAEQREAVHTHLRRVIDAANLLGVGVVSTFVGRNESKTVAGSITEGVEVFRGLLGYAADKGVKIAIENWPGVGTAGEGLIGNLFASPDTWARMFEALPLDNFGLNFDPSHLYWQGIDYLQAVRDFSERIFHVHAKDTEVFADRVAKAGTILPGNHWYRYRVPGFGKIEWPQFISVLVESGYDYTLSFEHEDPVWSGTEEKVTEGLIIGKHYLSSFIA